MLCGIRPYPGRSSRAEKGAEVPERDTRESDFAKVLREAAPYLGLGTALATTVGLLLALGFWLDARMGTKPALTLVFSGMGVGIALLQFVRMASTLNQRKPDPDTKDRPSKP